MLSDISKWYILVISPFPEDKAKTPKKVICVRVALNADYLFLKRKVLRDPVIFLMWCSINVEYYLAVLVE